MALFELGRTVATPGALRFLAANNVNPSDLLHRHAAGDFGDLEQLDVDANVRAVQHDLRILSAYKFQQGKVWVITEADRSSTCLMLPDEY